jgi:hypothetical protein
LSRSCSTATLRSRVITPPPAPEIDAMITALQALYRTRPDQVTHLLDLTRRLVRAANDS